MAEVFFSVDLIVDVELFGEFEHGDFGFVATGFCDFPFCVVVSIGFFVIIVFGFFLQDFLF